MHAGAGAQQGAVVGKAAVRDAFEKLCRGHLIRVVHGASRYREHRVDGEPSSLPVAARHIRQPWFIGRDKGQALDSECLARGERGKAGGQHGKPHAPAEFFAECSVSLGLAYALVEGQAIRELLAGPWREA